ncbi:hypothetical protein TNCT_687891 [Trichonephila clavata]|uniref:Uncharacterized protein n=1 Tax=Trichonephila clavata TaxID=2740835 RepID=A0A8X6G5W5_TRICU|nr:hypothetical protein TNCT_687891 [Trichonephila clavata]
MFQTGKEAFKGSCGVLVQVKNSRWETIWNRVVRMWKKQLKGGTKNESWKGSQTREFYPMNPIQRGTCLRPHVSFQGHRSNGETPRGKFKLGNSKKETQKGGLGNENRSTINKVNACLLHNRLLVTVETCSNPLLHFTDISIDALARW